MSPAAAVRLTDVFLIKKRELWRSVMQRRGLKSEATLLVWAFLCDLLTICRKKTPSSSFKV